MFMVYIYGGEREYIEGITAYSWEDADKKAKAIACGCSYDLKRIF